MQNVGNFFFPLMNSFEISASENCAGFEWFLCAGYLMLFYLLKGVSLRSTCRCAWHPTLSSLLTVLNMRRCHVECSLLIYSLLLRRCQHLCLTASNFVSWVNNILQKIWKETSWQNWDLWPEFALTGWGKNLALKSSVTVPALNCWCSGFWVTSGWHSVTLGATRSLLGTTRSHMCATRSLLGATRALTDATQSLLGATRSLLDATRSLHFCAPLSHLWVPLGHFLVPLRHFWVRIGHFLAPLGHFWVPLGHFWVPLGHLWVPLGHSECRSVTSGTILSLLGATRSLVLWHEIYLAGSIYSEAR